jgi:hypothetical protein
LVATFQNFPGVRIPLLSDEECKARRIERGKFPPLDTWTPEQQAAGRRFGKILADMAVKQAMHSMLRHLEAMQSENYLSLDPERDGINRALEAMLSDLNPPSYSDSFQPRLKSRSARKRRSRYLPKAPR